MTNFLVLFISLFAGLFLRRLKNFPQNSATVLNQFIIYVSLPSLVLTKFPKLLLTMDYTGYWWIPISMAWITFLFSVIFFSFIGSRLNWSNAKTGALILTAGLGNTSFVGFPLLEAIIGPHAIPYGVLIDQPGSFLVLSTLGIIVASAKSGTSITWKIVCKRVLSFPPFLAMVASIFWYFTMGIYGNQQLDFLLLPLEKIGSTLVPLALFSVGFQLKLDKKILIKRWLPLTTGLVFKLVFIPAFFALLFIEGIKGDALMTQVVVLESAMATMITSAVVAQEFNLDVEIANLMVGVSIPLSLISVPLWNWFLF